MNGKRLKPITSVLRFSIPRRRYGLSNHASSYFIRIITIIKTYKYLLTRSCIRQELWQNRGKMNTFLNVLKTSLGSFKVMHVLQHMQTLYYCTKNIKANNKYADIDKEPHYSIYHCTIIVLTRYFVFALFSAFIVRIYKV